jgi:hypothetical protein
MGGTPAAIPRYPGDEAAAQRCVCCGWQRNVSESDRTCFNPGAIAAFAPAMLCLSSSLNRVSAGQAVAVGFPTSAFGPMCNPPTIDWNCWHYCRDFDIFSTSMKTTLTSAYTRAAAFLADRISFRYPLDGGLQLMTGAAVLERSQCAGGGGSPGSCI